MRVGNGRAPDAVRSSVKVNHSGTLDGEAAGWGTARKFPSALGRLRRHDPSEVEVDQ